ncbi:MAG: DNA polymerase III subunit alpha, partial [bacterium]
LARHASTHAAGVVITPDKLTKYVPLFKSTKGEVTTQYDMKSIEEIGLLKMDFLGLRTLSVIQEATDLIAENRELSIDWQRIPLDDAKTFDLLARGDTVGVFQFESSGMRDYLRKLKPESLEDMIAMNALYRPGPLSGDMIDDFIHRKHGLRRIEYEHPVLEPILKETYGVIVYQEQVMRIASQLAGFSLGKADLLRRAMGKKQVDTMAEQREEFVAGATKRGIKKSVANKTFDLMAHFAGYGFNKSHSAAYAHIAYQTAYLKAHYPLEFMAATMSSEMDNTDRIVVLMEECRRMSIEVLPPDVNESYARFRVTNTGLRFGLGAIKNVGLGAIDSLVKARGEGGAFTSLYDFCQRVDLRLVNKRVIESLIQAGAMDSLKGHRPQLMAVVEQAIEAAQAYQNDRLRGQTSFFEVADGFATTFQSLPEVPEWPASETLAKEKEVLGFYLSGHPLAKYEEEIKSFSTHSVSSLKAAKDGEGVTLGGSFLNVKQITDRKGKPMAFATLEDFTGTMEILIFSDLYEKQRPVAAKGSMVLVRGRVTVQEEEVKIIAKEITPLSEVRREVPTTVHIALSTVGLEDETVDRLAQTLEDNPGRCAVCLHLDTLHGGKVTVRSKRFRVTPTSEAIDQMRSLVGEKGVWLGPTD